MAGLLIVLVLMSRLLHPTEELEQWVEEWEEKVLDGFTQAVLDEWLDMANRHPAFFGRLVPEPSPTPQSTTTAPSTASTGDPTSTPTTTLPPATGTWPSVVERWRFLVEAHFPANQVEMGLCIIRWESTGDPTAKNPRSSASGLWQHLARYWSERSVKAGVPGASIWDPEASTIVAAWLWRQDGWVHWTARRNC